MAQEGKGESLDALQVAFLGGPNPLCIDVVDRSEEGTLRSSNSLYLRTLPREDAQALARLVKELAGLDPSTRRAQSGAFRLQDEQFTVNCCPQHDGEILVVYRYENVNVLPRRLHRVGVP